MSIEPSSFPEHTDTADEVEPEDDPPCGGASGIRRQAAEIIDAVLSASEPERAEVRDQLRRCLAAHPGRPEAALVEHLLALRSLTGFPAGISDLPLPGGATPPQPLDAIPSQQMEENVRSRIEAVLQGRMLVTAFQPISDLSSRGVVGVQALTRFLSDGRDEAAGWFAEARDQDLESDLEFAAMESALTAARLLPDHLYVALKLSAATCLDPLLPGVLEESAIAPGRLVLELTEAMTREQPAALVKALAPLRRSGVRLGIDHAGSYFTSIRHIRELEPDIIKLDRTLVAGIDTDPLRSSLAEAMIGFARHIDAVVTAEGIETPEELSAVTGLGATAGQGYLLGAPTIRPGDWSNWTPAEDLQGPIVSGTGYRRRGSETGTGTLDVPIPKARQGS
ncbi:EAL domain-containing protein [Arthrobacter sp. C9C5]|uniref:EAL domain-containing protein n=1 Tax=Arthrobacter sp. C9C5 TaxID=2735267 RepID=UPI001584BB41|nr:EAL domain-containing protein [Arthrobacter sp. C9C5]NUU33068.1 EAL domain-containing protein [Arthrobacter sp. C9C5]